MKRFAIIIPALYLTACSHTYYIVRHAEKAANGQNMSSDVPLSDQGQKRAELLRELLKNKQIRYIYSTNTIRTRSTAEPLEKQLGLSIESYGPRPDTLFIDKLKSLKKNSLIVGHSNTVDDLVNSLTGKKSIPSDLQDSEYNNLFVVKYSRFIGKKISFETRKFGN